MQERETERTSAPISKESALRALRSDRPHRQVMPACIFMRSVYRLSKSDFVFLSLALSPPIAFLLTSPNPL
jgi:hypothetical protein